MLRISPCQEPEALRAVHTASFLRGSHALGAFFRFSVECSWLPALILDVKDVPGEASLDVTS